MLFYFVVLLLLPLTEAVPSIVTGVTLSVVSDQAAIRVDWHQPSVDGSFIRYEVEYGEYGVMWIANVTVQEADSLTTVIANLDRGTRYVVRVRAVSSAGDGLYSAAPRPNLILPSLPPQVTGVSASVVSGRTITVNWNMASVEGTFIRYDVQYKTNSQSWDASTTETVDGQSTVTVDLPALQRGTTYNVRVRAVSNAGNGPDSTEETTTVPRLPPQVTGVSLSVVSGQATIRVTWTKPSVEGTFTRYDVQHKTSSQEWNGITRLQVTGENTVTVDLPSLQRGTTYNVRVRAVSNVGNGPNSEEATYTLPGLPSQVTGVSLSVVSGEATIRVTWTKPSVEGAFTRYDVQPKTSSQNWGDLTARQVTGENTVTVDFQSLQRGTTYNVRIRAVSNAGNGNYSAEATSTVPRLPPQVTGVSLSVVSGQAAIRVSWNNPIVQGTFMRYDIQYRSSSQSYITRTLMDKNTVTIDLPGLQRGTTYTVRVRAVSNAGDGPYSAEDTFTLPGLPPQVTGVSLSVVSGQAAIKVSWNNPFVQGTFTRYDVQYKTSSQSYIIRTVMDKSTVTVDLTGLQRGIDYTVRVRAVSNAGNGDYSAEATSYVPRVPAVVSGVDAAVVKVNDTITIAVTWSPPQSDVPITHYEVDFRDLMSSPPPLTRADASPANFTGTSGVSYKVRVRAVSAAGNGGWSPYTPIAVDVLPTPTPTPTEGAIIAAVVVVIILLVIAIIITVVVIVLVFRFRRKLGKSFSPTQSESEVEIKGGKGHELNLSSLPGGREAYDSREDLEGGTQNGKVETNTYETVTTSMGAAVAKSDFASHVTMMHKERDSGFEKEYLSIINDPEGVEAIAKANKLKNRYINIHTFDHSRVVLTVPDDKGSDYINASYIDGYKRESAYIASQGPTPSTITDFWQMIVDHKAPVIVMLTKVEEKGKKKCEQYWEETLNTKVDKGRGIQVTTVKFTPFADYEVREFQVTSSSSPSVQPLKVKHFLYTAWPDHGVPQHPSSLVRFTHKVRRAYQNSAAPIIVHCSAGVGRTGTYLTIDAMLQRIKEVDSLNVFEFVVEMRSKRTFMVQNQDQYAFIHDALCDYITCGDTSVAAHELRRVIIEMEATDPKTKRSGFDNHFEFLESLSKSPCSDDVKYAKKQSISKKNRFKDRFPYSNSHMRVPGKSPSNGSDYINASYVDSYSRKNAFIAAQTPLSSTVADFWELLWQFKPPTVVILTSADDDKDGADFWPTQEEGVVDYGVVKVNHKATMPCSDYDRHTLEVVDRRKDKCTPYNLKVFHFKTWSSNSTPHFSSLLDMIGEIDKCTVGSAKPLVVACSDGISRTGVFVSVMSEVERVKAESEVDLFQTIKAARAKRPYFVYTAEQYKLCFDILQAYLDSFDTYANFKV